ncbi:unnamed protein product [Heligmosomoides polygyrus]|uniref:G protein-coupled receptor n=1 Tax=Heligmosomoides polygyrus TaxID=6339 RepID=A0A3P8BL17_HELPZ|nr:unnamed protein product [Heligmosomoides polygyrus]
MASLTTVNSIEVLVDDTHLFDTYVFLPMHCFTSLYLAAIMVSLVSNRHMQQRPRRMFICSCSVFLLAAIYNLIADLSYLVMVHKEMTLQQCSAIRNFLLNPLATQGLVDAVDRFVVIFGYGPLPESTIIIFYLLFPLTGVAFSLYNTVLSNELVLDETQDRYYKDRSILSLFTVCCILPIVFATPTLLISGLQSTLDIENKAVDLAASVFLDFAIPSIWTAYVIYIPSIRCGLLEMIRIPRTLFALIKVDANRLKVFS